MRLYPALITIGLIALTGCDPYPSTMTPDYTIRVLKTPEHMFAIAPTCPDRVNYVTDPYDNQPMPQFGCADKRNLAMSVERPSDIVEPRDLGPARGVTQVGAIRRYDNNQTRGFIYPAPSLDTAVDVTTSSSASSPLTGDVTGGAGTSSGGGSSSSTSTGTTSSGTSSSGSSGTAP